MSALAWPAVALVAVLLVALEVRARRLRNTVAREEMLRIVGDLKTEVTDLRAKATQATGAVADAAEALRQRIGKIELQKFGRTG